MREVLRIRAAQVATGALLGVTALEGCSIGIDSYETDASNVHCDGKRTEASLHAGGMATFIVHGKHKGDIATIQIKREDSDVSVKVTGDVTGPPQQLQADGFTPPTPIVPGAELSAFGAGGAWIIDASKDSAVIEGNCDGM